MSIQDRLTEQEDRLAELERLVRRERHATFVPTPKSEPIRGVPTPKSEPIWGPDQPWKTKESYENAVKVAMWEKQRRLAQSS